MENLNNEKFECIVCNEDYNRVKKPFTLKCGHTFCKKCIDTMIGNNSNKCPICKQETLKQDSVFENRDFLLAIEELQIKKTNIFELENLVFNNKNNPQTDFIQDDFKFILEMICDQKHIEHSTVYGNRMEFCKNHNDRIALSYNLHTNQFLCDICSTIARDSNHHIKKIKPKDFKCLRSLQDNFVELIDILNTNYHENIKKVKSKSEEILIKAEKKNNAIANLIDDEIRKLQSLKESLNTAKNELEQSLKTLENRLESWRENIIDKYLSLYGVNIRNKSLQTIERISKSLTHDESKIEILERFENDVFKDLFIKEFNSFVFNEKNEGEISVNKDRFNSKMKDDIDAFFENSIIKSLDSESTINLDLIFFTFYDSLCRDKSFKLSILKNKFETSLEKIEIYCVKIFEDLLEKVVGYKLNDKNINPSSIIVN